MNFEKLKQVNPGLYEDDELIEFRNLLEIEYGKITDSWAEEFSGFIDEDFDPYTFSGERRVNKLNKKYTKESSDILVAIDLINEELNRREKYKEEQRYSGTSNFSYGNESLDEFIEKEDLKTLSHKQDIEENK